MATTAAATFDAAASDYTRQLHQGISLSGESADYFVEGRVAFLAGYLKTQSPPHDLRVLDFGCGVGDACGALSEQLQAKQVIGIDCSAASIQIARQRHAAKHFNWSIDGGCLEPRSIDVAYTSGVFHHIEPDKRQVELERIYSWLKPGGIFALFENNPWNPGTQWVMSRIPFDRDAKCLSPWEAHRRLCAAKFQLQQTRSLFYFPRFLSYLRPMECLLAAVPLGAQYVVLARRPLED